MLDTSYLIRLLLWFGAIGCGLLAGVYFAFSAFIMTAFDRLEPAQGVSAMNSINFDSSAFDGLRVDVSKKFRTAASSEGRGVRYVNDH
jgi:hypothetical protein